MDRECVMPSTPTGLDLPKEEELFDLQPAAQVGTCMKHQLGWRFITCIDVECDVCMMRKNHVPHYVNEIAKFIASLYEEKSDGMS